MSPVVAENTRITRWLIGVNMWATWKNYWTIKGNYSENAA